MQVSSTSAADLPTGPAARFLEVDARTLRRWTDEGRITCRRAATGRRLYSLADLDALKQSRATK